MVKLRRIVYDQADYLARKSFYVHVHELPDGMRRELLRIAWIQIKSVWGRINK